MSNPIYVIQTRFWFLVHAPGMYIRSIKIGYQRYIIYTSLLTYMTKNRKETHRKYLTNKQLNCQK